MKNEVENAILYIRDYVQAYNERSASAVARKLMDAVNLVIDEYNETEIKLQRLKDITEQRDLFMHLMLGGRKHGLRGDDYKRVPAMYYFLRLPDDGSLEDFQYSLHEAAYDYELYNRNLQYIDEEKQTLNDLTKLLNAHENNKEWCEIIAGMMEQTRSAIAEYRESARKYA